MRSSPGDASVVASADTPFDYPGPAGAQRRARPPRRIRRPWPRPPGKRGAAEAAARRPIVSSIWSKPRWSGPATRYGRSAKTIYGDPTRYPVIYEANKWQIHNPNLIYPGEVFVVPKSEPKP